MKTSIASIGIWGVAASLAALPWVTLTYPELAPATLVLGLALLVAARWARSAVRWPTVVVAGSALACLLSSSTWRVSSGWLALAIGVAMVAVVQPRRMISGRPDVADMVGLTGWATGLAVLPDLMLAQNGGWLAPALLLASARSLAITLWSGRGGQPEEPGPPSRRARGTLSLRGVILGERGLPRSVPIDLELRAGASLAVLCDSAVDAEAFGDVISGRRDPVEGEVAIDAVPLESGDRLVAMVRPGERFLHGGVEVNLAALCDEDLEPTTVAAVTEACSIGDVTQELGDRMIEAGGTPLSLHHRLLLQAARIVPSHYRVVVVDDPVAWLNAVQGELWRAAVVRASVGRTAVWITCDRGLAERASMVMELRHGALRACDGRVGG